MHLRIRIYNSVFNQSLTVENKKTYLGGFTVMKKAKLFGLGAATLALTLTLAACGGGNNSSGTTDSSGGTASSGGTTDAEHSAVVITDIGGVDDKSFNQSAWEGLTAWGEEHGLSEGTGGYAYIQSNDASEYTTNVDSAVSQGFKTIFGIGYLLEDAVSTGAAANPDTNFVIVDSIIDDMDNVASATFRDNEAAYLAGYGAAYTTLTNQVGFIGGEEGVVIDRFQAGFEEGVAAAAEELGKDIEVKVEYAASFGDPAKGKAIAASMYNSGVDVIYHASGGTGAGVFEEAIALNEAGEGDKVWVIGVDRDQEADGDYTDADGNAANLTLTSTLKGVGAAVEDLANRALDDDFPGGEHLYYGLADGGVDITEGNLSDEAMTAINTAKQAIIDGDVTVSETPAE